jgi:hypothetical protein
MLTLKKGHELNWFDLKYIESPLMAKRTVQSNHGTRFGGEIIHNGNEHGLPDNRSKVFEPYGAINNKLDNGQVFLINNSTQMPVIAQLEITANNTAKWKLNHGQNLMFLNALDAALNRVQVPKPYGVLRDEPAAPAENQTSAEKTVREKHIFLLDLEGQNDRPLPPKHNITLVVENTTQSSLPVRQLKEVIYDSFSRVFTAEQGDAFKVFAISDSMLEVKKDLNENKNLSQSESAGLIAALQETGQETRADGAILHHIKYEVPTTHITSSYAKDQLELLAKRLSYPAFLAFLQPIFGSDIPEKNYRSLHKKLCDGEVTPPEIVIETSLIEGHEAAFNINTQRIHIYERVISRSVANLRGQNEKLLAILVEEFGHYIDHKLRNDMGTVIGGDAKNDEGAILTYQLAHQNLLSDDLVVVAHVESEKLNGDLTIDVSTVRAALSAYSSEYDQMDDGKSSNYEFFGAGYGNRKDKRSHGHRSIEQVLVKAGFDAKDELPTIYFGNWLRDFSQVIDPSMVRPSASSYKSIKDKYPNNPYIMNIEEENGFKLSRGALTKLVGLLAVQEFKKDRVELALKFKNKLWAEDGAELLGCYRPEEHIDNPIPGPIRDHDKWVDYNQLDKCFAKPPTLKQLEVNPDTLLKNYIATDLGGDQNFEPATHYVGKKLKQSIKDGRTDEGLIALGEALHVVEDFFSHSNFIELALIELGYDQVYPWVSDSGKINGKYPLVTGGFGSTDMAHSLAPKFHAIIPHEIKPYDSPDLKNIAPDGQEPKWRSADDELILLILADIDQAEVNNIKGVPTEVDGGYLGLYQEYLKYRDLVRNKKANPLIKWAFEGAHYTLQTITIAVTAVMYHLLEPLAHAIDDGQTIHQDIMGQEVGTNPTHSQLAKDHDDHPLHDIAAKLAQMAVEEIGKEVMYAYKGIGNTAVATEVALGFIVHPKDVIWYKVPLETWVKSNKNKLERTYSRHEIEHLTETVWEDAKEALDGYVNKVKSWPVWNYKNKLLEAEK